MGIPRAGDAALYSTNLIHPSHSQVFEVNVGKAFSSGVAFPDYGVREVCTNDEKELSFATTPLVYQDRLLVGTVGNNVLLYMLCQLIHY